MGTFNASLRTLEDPQALPATVHLDEGRIRILIGKTPIGDWELGEVEIERVDSGYKVAAEGEHILLDLEDAESFSIALHMSSPKPPKRRLKKTKAGPETTRPKREPRRPRKPREEKAKRPKGRSKPEEQVTPLRLSTTQGPPAPVALSPEPVREVEPEAPQESPEEVGGSRVRRTWAMVQERVDRIIDAAERRFGSLLPEWVFTRLVFWAVVGALVLTIVFPGVVSTFLLIAGVLLVVVGAILYTDDILASKWLPGRTTPIHVLILGVAVLMLGVLLGILAP